MFCFVLGFRLRALGQWAEEEVAGRSQFSGPEGGHRKRLILPYP